MVMFHIRFSSANQAFIHKYKNLKKDTCHRLINIFTRVYWLWLGNFFDLHTIPSSSSSSLCPSSSSSSLSGILPLAMYNKPFKFHKHKRRNKTKHQLLKTCGSNGGSSVHKHSVATMVLISGTFLYEISLMMVTNVVRGERTGLQEQLQDDIKFIFSQQRKTNSASVTIVVTCSTFKLTATRLFSNNRVAEKHANCSFQFLLSNDDISYALYCSM